ncbi:hypothetical protein KIN20_031318 [Parelaphostrongylus tenuis]|uniref:Uncharacterized protein n=1 Tax=Parelaphostrongylus tenuis TaxID=148309 RepID=A0AAD5R4Z4_PARTN|nr:hypothetical protein KIN20_031318 [Parelaphostrongylus tenuis]
MFTIQPKELRKFVLRVLPKHHHEKKQRNDEVEHVRKERQMKREFSLTPSPDDRLTGNVKKREYSASLERLKKKDADDIKVNTVQFCLSMNMFHSFVH